MLRRLDQVAVAARRHRDRVAARYGAGSIQLAHAERAVAAVEAAIEGYARSASGS